MSNSTKEVKLKSRSSVSSISGGFGIGGMQLLDNMEFINKKFELDETPDADARRSSVGLALEDAKIGQEIIEPSIPFSTLEKLVEISQVLTTSIEAMKTNVAGFGYTLTPMLDIKNQDGIKVYRETAEPIPQEMLDEMDKELEMIEMFLESLSLDISFIELNKRRVHNLEEFGNAFWEWERDFEGEYTGATILPTKTIRLMKKDKRATPVNQFIRNPKTFEYIEQPRMKRFRRFIQMVGSSKVYFKEYGDPRIMNATDGKYLMKKDGTYFKESDFGKLVDGGFDFPDNFVRATEIMHFNIYCTAGPYGKPRWLPSTPEILGVRAAGIVNQSLLENNSVPPLAVIVEGYEDKEMVKKIEEFIKNKVKGKDSFSKILVIQAETQITGLVGPNGNAVKPSIKIEPLSQVLTKDGMFLEYINNSTEKIVSSFRLSNLFIGLTKDINRATASVAKEQVEEQVFTPMRVEFDFIMNNMILNSKKVKYWKFESKSGKLEDIELKAKIVEAFTKAGILIPNDGRRIASDLLGEIFESIPEAFMNKPKDIVVAELRSQGVIRSSFASKVDGGQFENEDGQEPEDQEMVEENIEKIDVTEDEYYKAVNTILKAHGALGKDSKVKKSTIFQLAA